MEADDLSTPLLSDREIKVCEILLNLKKLISEFESKPLNLNWGAKKPRSRMHFIPNPNPLRFVDFISVFRHEEGTRKLRGEADSPNTPLGFHSSGSHEKVMESPGNLSKKRKRKDLFEKIEKLEQNRDDLRRALEAVKDHHSKLIALNLELKAKKIQMQLGPFENQDHPEKHHVDNYHPLNTDPTAQTGPINIILSVPCNQRSHRAPLDIDLNAPPSDSFEMD